MQALAQTNLTWNVNTNGNWSTSSNWSPANVPNISSEVAIFDRAAGATVTFDSNNTVGGLTFKNTAGTFVISKTTGGLRTLTLGAYGITNEDDTTQTVTGSSLRLTLGAAASFTVSGTGNLVIGTTGGNLTTSATNILTLTGNGTGIGSISSTIDGTNGIVIKNGSGTWQLSGTNSYTGGTQFKGGTLVANSSGALGTSGTLSFSGGTLQYGTGITTDYSSRIANSTSAIAVDTNGNNVTFASALANTNTGGLTKSGTGTLTLSGANNYTGTTTLAGGTLVANNATALGSSGNVTFTGGTLQYGTGITTDYSSRIANSTSAIAVDTNGNNVTFASALANTNTGGLTKSGTGTLTLSGANNYTGATTINGGTVNIRANTSLGTGAVTVNTGSTLSVQGGNVTASNAITLAGGTLSNVSGDLNWFSGNVTLTAGSTINSATANDRLYIANSGTTVNLGSNTLVVDGAGKTIFIGAVGAAGEAGNFTSNSTGEVWFNSQSQVNNFTGTTTVNRGTLVLGTNNNVSFYNTTIRGNLIIGNGTDTATVLYPTGYGNEKVADSSTVTINRYGTLDLNNAYDTIGALNLNGGAVALGTGGTLVLTGDVTVGNSAATSTISGYQFWLTPSSGDRTLTVADGAQTSDLLITATVASGNLIKAGAGTLTLAGDNIYTGTTSVNAGILNVRSNTGLGSVTNGTSVTSGAALELQQDPAYNGGANISIGSETLTLNGTGYSLDPINSPASTGALRNINGDNTWGGSITLGSASRINSDSGKLTLNGAISGAGQSLTVGGAGDTWINGVIGTSTGGTVTKDGTGTLTLTGNNNYAGATTISSGVVNIRHDYALGTTAGGTTVGDGAALQIQADASYNSGNPVSVGAEALTLNGTGISNTGALRNISGNNSFAGAITIASATSRINSDSGTLTLGAGGVALGANSLAVGGAGDVTISGPLTGTNASSLTKDGNGTLTLSGANNNSFLGNVTLSSGTLAMGANNALNNAAIDVAVNGGTFSLQSYAQTVGTISNTTLGVGTIDFGGNGSLTLLANSTYSGNFTGTGSLIVGAGVTLTLGNNFNASGVTIVLAGGTLNLNGTTTTFAGLTLTGSSTIDFASGDSVVNFTDLSLGSYALAVAGWTDQHDFFHVTNQPGTYQTAPLNQVTFAPSGAWDGNDTIWDGNNVEVRPWKPVPEPSTYGAIFMGAGLALFGFRRWRQQRVVAKK